MLYLRKMKDHEVRSNHDDITSWSGEVTSYGTPVALVGFLAGDETSVPAVSDQVTRSQLQPQDAVIIHKGVLIQQ